MGLSYAALCLVDVVALNETIAPTLLPIQLR
jgi:hypothetical protein